MCFAALGLGCSEANRAAAAAPSHDSFRAAGPTISVQRRPLLKRTITLPANRDLPRRLVVKFTDPAQVRTTQGRAFSRTGVALEELDAVVQEHGLSVVPMFRGPTANIERMLESARDRTTRAQPDLLGLHHVDIAADSADAELAAAKALQDLDVVEFAYFETIAPPPPATDIAPVTPDLTDNQGYRGADNGIDMENAALIGIDGTGVRITDVEYSWNFSHEEWNDGGIMLQPGVQIPPDVLADGSHGTGVAGVLVARGEGYGIAGMTPGASFHAYPEITVANGWQRVVAVTQALADSSPGDIVLLEMQAGDATFGDYGPGELEEAVWLATRVGVDAGVVVVAAAGNGALDLDRPELAYYRDRGDSGAIIVGAGDSLTHAPLYFTTYGTRVDVQGWGFDVFTCGTGNFAEYGGDVNQRYTATFNGTSSASPIVVAAATLIQQVAIDNTGPLSSTQMRDILISTGRPQGAGVEIGPLPQVGAALTGPLAVDEEPPTVSFDTPQADIDVPEATYVTALRLAAVDAISPVSEVQISINGELLPNVDTEAPFEFEDVTFPEGTWEVVAFATDVWGNEGRSETLTIRVGFEDVGDSSDGAPGESSGESGTEGDPETSGGDEPDLPPQAEPEGLPGGYGGRPTGDAGCSIGRRGTTPAWTLVLLLALVRRRRPSGSASLRGATHRRAWLRWLRGPLRRGRPRRGPVRPAPLRRPLLLGARLRARQRP